MRYLSLAFVLFFNWFCTAEVKYDYYKVFSAIPNTTDQLNALRTFRTSKSRSSEYDFWTDNLVLGSRFEVMVAPQSFSEWFDFLEKNAIKASIVMEDVQKAIDVTKDQSAADGLLNNRAGNILTFLTYQDFTQIQSFLTELQREHPTKATQLIIGKSHEDNPIQGLKIKYPNATTTETKNIIFFECGIHAREWISPAVCLYFINELLINTAPHILNVVQNYEWHIIPVTNPDGYIYTWLNDRLWRKTREILTYFIYHPPLIVIPDCIGTDPNRNFDFHWGEVGSSNRKCADTYRGTSAFSIPETRAIRDHITAIKDKLLSYISIHSYGQYCLLPYSVSSSKPGVALKPDDYDYLLELGRLAMNHLKTFYNTEFTVGNTMEELYQVSGDSTDWVKSTFNVTLPFSFELRDKGTTGFLLQPTEIIPSGIEFFNAIVYLINQHELKQSNY